MPVVIAILKLFLLKFVNWPKNLQLPLIVYKVYIEFQICLQKLAQKRSSCVCMWDE